MFGRRLRQLISILCLAGHKLLVMGNVKPSSQQVAVVRRVKVYQSLGSKQARLGELRYFSATVWQARPAHDWGPEVTKRSQTPGKADVRAQ